MANENVQNVAKPKSGSWDNLQIEQKPSVKFEMDKEVTVVMMCEKPREIDWEGSVFYVFDVLHDGKEECIKTSAWSLLKGLKRFEPLAGKTLKISKAMFKGKQIYKVSS